jgi:hypothetical protein
VRLDEEEPHFIVVDLLITGYLLEELTASRLLCPIILIFWGFAVQISLKANPDDRVLVDGIPIGGRAGPSIRFVVVDCLTTA